MDSKRQLQQIGKLAAVLWGLSGSIAGHAAAQQAATGWATAAASADANGLGGGVSAPPVAWPAPAPPVSRFPGGQQPPVVTTRQTSFPIPFALDHTTDVPIEVQLYVSQDYGSSWRLYGQQRPGGQFRFEARLDGEYWFASRTMDLRTPPPPIGQLQPQLRVRVDTQQPQLELDAFVGPAGQIRTSWRASDSNLDATSLKIEYYDGGAGSDGRWRAVPIEVPNSPQPSLVGSKDWWAETSAQTILVRADVKDLAGNSNVITRRLYVPSVASQRPSLGVPNMVAASPMRFPGGSSQVATVPPADPFAQISGASAGSPTPAATASTSSTGSEAPTHPTTSSAPGSTLPDSNQIWGGPGVTDPGRSDTAGVPLHTASYPSTRMPAEPAGPAPVSSAAEGLVPHEAQLTDPAASLRRLPAIHSPQAPVASPIHDRVASQYVPAADANQPAVHSTFSPPPDVQPRVTSSRGFQLDYQCSGVGPTGAAQVELWVTEDGGQSWTRWGTDPDLQSPFDVEVERDGTYGFRVVVVSKSGLAARQPSSGDRADIWVSVDATQPVAELTGAQYGEGPHAGQLLITWQITEARLAEQPITLLYGESAAGPWSTIATGVANTGQYNWTAGPDLPASIYLRLEVTDQAGNQGIDQLDEPINTTGLSPRGFIQGFRPLTRPENAPASPP